MNVPVKSKRKKHTDPYCGGEQSGKRARTDAHHPLGMTDIISTTQPLPLSQSANSIGASTIQLSTPGPGKTSLSQPVLCAATPTLQNQLNATEALKSAPLLTRTHAPTELRSSGKTDDFDATKIDIRDLSILQHLKRQHLNSLCFFHRVSAGGTNQAIIERLLQAAPPAQYLLSTQ